MINLQPMKRIMNATAKLQATFAPISELNSWVQPIRFSAAQMDVFIEGSNPTTAMTMK